MESHTWLGTDVLMILPSGAEYRYSWLDLLMPAIRTYWDELKAVLIGVKSEPNVVLPLDSLAVKIEGIVRHIVAPNGGTTLRQTCDDKGRLLTREKDINQLLREPKLIAAVGENNTWYLRFLLTEQGGFNLRNKVAHSLMLPGEYTWNMVSFLILAILRLAGANVAPTLDVPPKPKPTSGTGPGPASATAA